MKKSRLLLMIGLISMIAVVFSSCKKDDDDSDSLTRTEMLTGKYWISTAMTIDPPINIGGIMISNLWTSGMIPDCTKDDLQKFDANGVYTFDEGATKCIPTDPQTETGTWAFNANETVLTTILDGDTMAINVLSLTESSFKASTQDTLDFGTGPILYTITVTMAVK